MDNSTRRTQLRSQAAQMMAESSYTLLTPSERDRYYRSSRGYETNAMFMEDSLKEINTGEAYYRLEEAVQDIDFMTWPQEVGKLDENRLLLFSYLTQGIEFSYDYQDETRWDVVKLLDYENIGSNTRHVLTEWPMVTAQGQQNVWDVVLCINNIPLVVMLFDKELTHRIVQSDKPFRSFFQDTNCLLSLFVQFCLISDGTHFYTGTPDMFGNQFCQRNLDDTVKLKPIDTIWRTFSCRSLLHYLKYTVLVIDSQILNPGSHGQMRLLAPPKLAAALNLTYKSCLWKLERGVQVLGHVLLEAPVEHLLFTDLLMNQLWLSELAASYRIELVNDKTAEEELTHFLPEPTLLVVTRPNSFRLCARLTLDNPDMHILCIESRGELEHWGRCMYPQNYMISR